MGDSGKVDSYPSPRGLLICQQEENMSLSGVLKTTPPTKPHSHSHTTKPPWISWLVDRWIIYRTARLQSISHPTGPTGRITGSNCFRPGLNRSGTANMANPGADSSMARVKDAHEPREPRRIDAAYLSVPSPPPTYLFLSLIYRNRTLHTSASLRSYPVSSLSKFSRDLCTAFSIRSTSSLTMSCFKSKYEGTIFSLRSCSHETICCISSLLTSVRPLGCV